MINRRAGLRAMKRGLLAVFLVFMVSSASQAGPLGVVIDPYPDIIAGFITSTYDATTGAFSSTGFALTLDKGTGKQSITTGFKLLATIDNLGVATDASVTIGSLTSPLLLGLNLLQFGFTPAAGGALEFLFGYVGGSYVPGVYSDAKPLDVMITGTGTKFPGSFATNWSSSSNTAELRPDAPGGVPEPSTLLLMLVGAGAGGVYGRRKRAGVPTS